MAAVRGDPAGRQVRGARAPAASYALRALGVALVALLSGCGFHLRAAVDLPAQMDVVYVQGAPALGELGREITRSLESAGSRQTEERASATAILVIDRNEVRRRVLSVNRSGQVNEYELTYHLAFEVRNPEGKVLVPRQSVSLARDYTFDPNSVLAKGNEEAQLRGDMIGFAVRQMLRRIDSALKQAGR
ncbi:MAG TPA: LPS assembly lipoprotein LptE [Gammaproteobacteria bacterium]|nr:LPS assembly lipoprotein LptE [Gammaproteobacteria bacterium]